MSGKAKGKVSQESLRRACRALGRGDLVIVCDENDATAAAYLVAVGRRIDPAKINFMVTHARGHVCVALREGRMQDLGDKRPAPLTKISFFHSFFVLFYSDFRLLSSVI